MIAYFFLAGKDSVSMFLIALLVFKATENEFTLGKFIFLVSSLTVLTSYIMGKFSRPATRYKYVLTGSIVYFAAAFLLLYKINFQILLIYGILTAVSDYLIRIPLAAHALDVMNLDAHANERKMEYIVAKDVPIAAGRIITLGLFITLLQYMDIAGIKVIILLISTFPFMIYWSMYKN